jgi:DNA-binding GntR family transcriptional regulator
MSDDDSSRTLLRESVLSRLTSAILDGTLAPGTRLRDEDLTEWLGVSRAPIREAIDRLSDLGLVELSPKRFTRVARISPRLYVDSAAVWAALVARGLRRGILRFPADRIADLEAMNAELAATDPRTFPPGPTVIDRFVAAILRHCPNEVLLESIRVHDPVLALGVNRFKAAMDTVAVHAFFTDVIRRCRDHDVDGFEKGVRAFTSGPMRAWMSALSDPPRATASEVTGRSSGKAQDARPDA